MERVAADLAGAVDQDRLWSRLMTLAEFGKIADGGVNRQALSPEEAQARAYLVAEARALGLAAFTDCAGNLFLRLEGIQSDLPAVLVGSHIDSQPNGGRFDGAAGVLSGLEAVATMVAARQCPKRAIEIVAWTNEEASRFAPGMSGSEVFTGGTPIETVRALTDSDGISFGAALDAILAGDNEVPLRAIKRPYHAFIELHIEQGPELERKGIPVGIVTGMQGTRRYRVTVEGEAAHAGTTPRSERKDALMAAARMICAMDKAAVDPAGIKLTVGRLDVSPNAPSVVPERAFFSVDIRHPDNKVIDSLDIEIRAIVESEAGPCRVNLKQIAHAPSLDFPQDVRSVLQEAAVSLSLPTADLYSAAGHDARQLHYFCPTGMIFIPCRGGISHNPAEWSEADHVAAGARLLTATLWRLANDV